MDEQVSLLIFISLNVMQFKITYSVAIIFSHPEDWTQSWTAVGGGQIYGWGHNHRGQLGGVEGAKVKVPTVCEALSALRPIQLAGGEQTLFAITSDGRVYATGESSITVQFNVNDLFNFKSFHQVMELAVV